MRIKRFFLILLALCYLSGCQILNPYDEFSDCPDPYNGDCVTMETAYRRSKSDPKNSESNKIDPNHDSPLIKDRPVDAGTSPQLSHDNVYRHELYQEIAGLVKHPITPVRIPAKQMRVLILGYNREDRFYSHRYIFFESDKPRWILDIIEE